MNIVIFDFGISASKLHALALIESCMV